jgi:hypothetical protein
MKTKQERSKGFTEIMSHEGNTGKKDGLNGWTDERGVGGWIKGVLLYMVNYVTYSLQWNHEDPWTIITR